VVSRPLASDRIEERIPGLRAAGDAHVQPKQRPGGVADATAEIDGDRRDEQRAEAGAAEGHVARVGGGDVDQLVILAFPGFGANFPAAVPADQVAKFNAALKTIGVGPIDPTVFTQQSGGEWQEFAIVGVPNSGDGSGQYAATFKNEDLLTGWLMPDALKAADAFRFRFQPERPVFDTSSSHTDTTNTMTVRDQHVDAVLPDGTADPLLRSSAGFQVVKLDPIHFTPVDSAVFATNYINQEQNGYGY